MTQWPMQRWSLWRQRLKERVDLAADVQALWADDEVRRKACLVLADDLAAMVAGHENSQIKALVREVTGRGGVQESRLLDGSWAPREKAAAINAAAAAWDELDEGYRPATCHGGLYTIPAVIAEAEATGRSLPEVLAALVVGYEVVTSVARVFPAPRPLVLHPHATLSPIGAAAGVAWLRTADAEAVLAAADVAATMSMAGPFNHAVTGAQVRNAWPAAGATLGFLAADVAVAGLRAESTSARDVFASGYGHELADAELAHGFDRWAILDGYHKAYATCQYTHSALEATLDLVRGALAGRPHREIEQIEVFTHPLAEPLDNRRPATTLAGKFSLPHVIAAVLVTGSASADTFAERWLADADVDRLRQRVQISRFAPLPAPPHDRPVRVRVTLVDGTVVEASCPSAVGGPDRPLSEDEVLDKVAMLTRAAAPALAGTVRALLESPVQAQQSWSEFVDGVLG